MMLWRSIRRGLRRGLPLLAFWALAAAETPAAERLTIRLVQASNQGEGASAELRDVAPLLQRNLPYRRFDLLESRTVRLPADQALSFAAGLTVRCTGHENRLALFVESGGAVLLQTEVRLTGETPLILGGFPAPGGTRRLLVLTAR